MDYLEIDRHGRPDRQIVLDKPVFAIGRDPACEICLNHDRVSRRHAQLRRMPDGSWMIEDLQSHNHVYVNGEQVQERVLGAADEVRISDFTLRLVHQESASALLPPTVPPGAPAPSHWMVIEPAGRLGQLAPDALDQLQQFESALLQCVTSAELLEHLADECERRLAPRMLAVGTGVVPHYRWQVIRQNRRTAVEPDQRLGRLDERLRSAPREMVNWESVTDSDDSGPTPRSRACLLIPLKGREGVIGHVYVESPFAGVLLEPTLPYLKLACLHAGLVWENLQLAELRANHAILESQLQAAREIQLGLFPPRLDLDPRVDAFAVNQPSVTVSGDYYDLVRIDADHLVFVMADAVGHGLPAALLMAGVRAALRTALEVGADWPALFRSLDRVVESSTDCSVFVTGLVGRLDLGRQELELASAGHPLPLVLVDGRPVPISRQCSGRAWGMPFDVPWRVERLALAGDDWVILCFTDGITEAGMASSGSQWSPQRLAACLEDHWQESAEAMGQAILDAVSEYTGDDRLDDDRTLMVLRKGSGSSRDGGAARSG